MAAEGASFAGPALADSVTPTGVEVVVDIRPGSERNPVNTKANGVLPVGIFSSETFDATEADPSTIFLEGAPVTSPSEQGKYQASEEDLDGDGLLDLLVKIDVELLDLVGPTGSATLVGETFAGDPFWGVDTFTIVPPDIANDSWALQAVAACMGSEIVSGYPDGLYHPELTVTRGQMAVFIARALAGGASAVPKATGGAATFSDVNPSNWAYDAVQYISDAGIVTGYPDGTYQPDWTVSRGQMAAFVARAIAPEGEEGLSDYQAPDAPTFSDVEAASWCYGYVEYLAEQGVVGGYADATYRPDEQVKRDQMAVYVARAFELTM